MNYYILEPEVAFEISEDACVDYNSHPPIIKSLNITLNVWLGDDILESFPCYVMNSSTGQRILNAECSGLKLADVNVEISEQFVSLSSGKAIPEFVWAQITGVKNRDDFFLSEKHELVVSEKALKVLKEYNLDHAEIKNFKQD